MTDDPLTQAGDVIGTGLTVYGRELARKHFIDPAEANDCVVPDETIAQLLELAKTHPRATVVLMGMLCATIEEAAGILTAKKLILQRCEALDHQVRSLLAKATDPHGQS